ncbi:D-xylose 1-dehydrogenase (NADP(+))-like protein 1 [Elsinoe fawcettii]|nr:D-xylose 1-dehydrogenase (NADP(+))-like protein 1 [Elsinoe fawcettii]
MAHPKLIKWGILATGGIATAFGRDLSVDPATRGVTDVKHEVVAAASSNSKERAQAFLRKCDAPVYAKGYGSYKELVQDPDVDIIYIATPHSHHYQNVMLCLEHNKPVLCEKALTVNAAQAKALAAKAREKRLLLMESLWTRYFPVSSYVRETIASEKLGPIERVMSEHSLPYAGGFESDQHIMVNPDLAGGILLDAGVYSLTWVFMSLHTTQDVARRKRPVVQSAIAKHSRTGVDAMTTMLLEFPRDEEDGGTAHAIASTSLSLSNDVAAKQHNVLAPAVRIQGSKGELQVLPPAYRPEITRLILKDGTFEEKKWPIPSPGEGSGWYNGFGSTPNPEGEGHGLFWEADDAARAILEGRREGSQLGLDESILIMETMDHVREKAGLRYPDRLESTEYPLDLSTP